MMFFLSLLVRPPGGASMAESHSRPGRAVIGLRRDPKRNKIDLGKFCCVSGGSPIDRVKAPGGCTTAITRGHAAAGAAREEQLLVGQIRHNRDARRSTALTGHAQGLWATQEEIE